MPTGIYFINSEPECGHSAASLAWKSNEVAIIGLVSRPNLAGVPGNPYNNRFSRDHRRRVGGPGCRLGIDWEPTRGPVPHTGPNDGASGWHNSRYMQHLVSPRDDSSILLVGDASRSKRLCHRPDVGYREVVQVGGRAMQRPTDGKKWVTEGHAGSRRRQCAESIIAGPHRMCTCATRDDVFLRSPLHCARHGHLNS